jgi:hypothetical protein
MITIPSVERTVQLSLRDIWRFIHIHFFFIAVEDILTIDRAG